MGAYRKRNKQINIRVTDEEYEEFIEKVKLSKMPTERYFRKAILKSQVVIYDFKSLLELSSQINKIGNNINQIAKKLNEGKTIHKNEVVFLETTMKNINDILLDIYGVLLEQENK